MGAASAEAREYRGSSRGIDEKPEAVGTKTFPSGARRSVEYVDGVKVVTWDYTDDTYCG